MMKIQELHIYYYFVCPRKLWFYSRKITMEHEVDVVKIGKYIELFYKEEKKVREKIIIDNTTSRCFRKEKSHYFGF